MDISINLTVLKRKRRKDGKVPVYLRFTHDRKSRYKSTGIAIREKDWNWDRQEVRRTHRDYTHLNIQLGQTLRDITEHRDELQRQGRLTMNALMDMFSGPKKDTRSILHLCDTYRDKLHQDGRYWEGRHFVVVQGNIEEFIGQGASDRVDELTTGWLAAFQVYLLTKDNKNTPVTTRKKIQRLRGMVRWLLKTKQIEIDPYANFERVKAKKNGDTKVKLSFDQIKAIQALDLQPGSAPWHIRNFFMYSFYNAGIRFGDLCCLRWRHIVDGRLEYNMHKTGGYKRIKQTEEMQVILDQYRSKDKKPDDFIFPILDKGYDDPVELRRKISSRNAIANKNLQNIAKKAGIQSHISFHVARHSFAHHALTRGMNVYEISKALGHSDLSVTQDYLKSFDEDLLDKAMEGLFK